NNAVNKKEERIKEIKKEIEEERVLRYLKEIRAESLYVFIKLDKVAITVTAVNSWLYTQGKSIKVSDIKTTEELAIKIYKYLKRNGMLRKKVIITRQFQGWR
ncbi:MAG: hypothetical protein ACP5HJ_03475, partial [Candidatus Micrarchaeia archaeon]